MVRPDEPFSQDQLAWIEAAQAKGVQAANKRIRRRNSLAWFALLIGIIVVFGIDRNTAAEQRDKIEQTAAQQSAALQQSGSVVSVTGCNRDFDDRVQVRQVLQRSQQAVKEQFKRGDIGPAQYKRVNEFYEDRLAELPLLDCTSSAELLTTDLGAVPPVPTPKTPADAEQG